MNARSIGSAAWHDTQAFWSTSPGARQAVRPFVYAAVTWSADQLASGRVRQYVAGTGTPLAGTGMLRHAKIAAMSPSLRRAWLKTGIFAMIVLPWDVVNLSVVLVLPVRTIADMAVRVRAALLRSDG